MLVFSISELFFIASFFQVIFCGVQEFRIVGGRKTSAREFPYHAELLKKNQHWCGGALIHKQFVLTAAHCVKFFEKSPSPISVNDLHVRLGNDISGKGGVLYKIKAVFPHKYYVHNADTDTADIALVKLVKPVKFYNKVKIIKLSKQRPKAGTMSWVIGFGKQKVMRDNSLRHLMAVDLPVVDLNKCRSILDNVAGDMFCAGYSSGHKDACVGDSGGPLIIGDALSGIVAWGIGCGRPGIPGVYTNVAEYVPWIQNTIKSN